MSTQNTGTSTSKHDASESSDQGTTYAFYFLMGAIALSLVYIIVMALVSL